MVAQVDGIMDATMHSFCTKVYRAGFGMIGQVDAATNLATANLIVANLEDEHAWELLMTAVASHDRWERRGRCWENLRTGEIADQEERPQDAPGPWVEIVEAA